MAKKYLDDEGLRYLWTKIKPFANVQSDWNATEGDAFIKNKPTIPTVPSATTTTPKMDGTAAVGTETKWAKGDHVHPSDTSRVPTTRKVNGKALSADVNLYFADVKTSATDTTTLATALGNKVDKVTGKGLSTNDYTTAEKDKLANIEAGAEENVLEGVQVNGTDLTISEDKKVNIPLASSTQNGVIKIEAAGDPPKPSARLTTGWTPSYPNVADVKFPLIRDDGTISAYYIPDATQTVKGAMTAKDKTKLDGIESGAEANVLEGVQVNGTDLTITDKKVNVPVFTGATTSANGTVGLVPAPAKNKNICLLFGSGNWDTLDPQVFNNPNDVRFVFDTANTDTVLDYKVNAATTTASGVMSASDKTKLDGIREGANVKGSIVTKTSSYPSDAVLSLYDAATGEYSDFRVYSTQEMDTMFSGATTILNGKVDKTSIGQANGVAPLDANSKIDSQYLPSYVDDVVEAYARANQTELGSTWLATESATGTVITPEAGKIYVLMNDSTSYSTNTQFRWGGTSYIKLNDGGVSAITNAEIDTIVAS